MSLHAALAATATLVATAFALSTLERYLRNRRRHELMWTVSLAMFALGSLGLWAGAAVGWSEWTFKIFFVFGAVLNVPFLALGTVYLLASPRRADITAATVSLLAAFAAGIVIAAPIVGTIDPDVLPQGSAVFGLGPRLGAAIGSGVASVVIIGGATWSAWRLWRVKVGAGTVAVTGPAPGTPSPGRLAVANLLIAIGTLVSGAAGILNSVADAMDGFAISLVAGIIIIFAGFLLTNPASVLAPVEPWFPPDSLDEPAAHDETDATVTGSGKDADGRATRSDQRALDTSSTRPGSPSLN